MVINRHMWEVWARKLHQWGVQDAAASLLEACGPLAVLGAQAVYLGQPFLKTWTPDENLTALASMLEDKTETQAFVTYLREANQS